MSTQVRSVSSDVPALASHAHALLRIVASYLLLTHARSASVRGKGLGAAVPGGNDDGQSLQLWQSENA